MVANCHREGMSTESGDVHVRSERFFLIADNKAIPMIVVMPSGRAQKNDRAEGNVFAAAPAFAKFEDDVLKDVILTICGCHSVRISR